jgi:hypothetical protein
VNFQRCVYEILVANFQILFEFVAMTDVIMPFWDLGHDTLPTFGSCRA